MSVFDSQCGNERNAKRKSDGTVGKAMLPEHESKEDRPVGPGADNDLESNLWEAEFPFMVKFHGLNDI